MGEDSRKPETDIIIPVLNHFHLTRELLEGIYRYTESPFHIFIIDNGSTDETVDLHKIYTRDITVVRNRDNCGWASAVNQGIRMGSNSSVVVVGNDIALSKGWLCNLNAFLDSHPRIGAVGPLYSNPDHWQSVDRVRTKLVPQLPHFFTEDLHERNRILAYHFHRTGILIEGNLAFFCVAMRRRVLGEVGHFEETQGEVGDSADYCRRLRKAGYVIGLSLDTYVIHQSGKNDQPAIESGGRQNRAATVRER
jgi:GT2 family glycosyltransferase